MRHWQTSGLILSHTDSRDDKIIRLLLDTDELVPAIAKHSRSARGKSSKASQLQPLSAVSITLRAKAGTDVAWASAAETSRELALVERVELLHSFATLKGDLERFALACAMSEGILHLVPDWGVEEGLHALLVRALMHLDRPGEPPHTDLLALFFVRLLDRAGLLPASEELAQLTPPTRLAASAFGTQSATLLPPLMPFSEEAAETLALWREGRWRPLPRGESASALALLAELMTQASGRPLLSMALVTDVFRPAPRPAT